MPFYPKVEASFQRNMFAASLRWPHLWSYQHVLIEPEIIDFVFQAYETVDWERCLVDARPLSDQTLFYVPAVDRSGVIPVEVSYSQGWCKLWALQKTERLVCGRYQPGGAYECLADVNRFSFKAFLHVLSFVVALANQPRFVVYDPAISRQQRRKLARQFGVTELNAHRVRWNIGETVRKQIRSEGAERCMPLHFRRGHWRHAEPHFAGAVQRPNALIEADRTAWWQWIAETWVGHPAFGFKASVHQPSIGKFKDLFDGA